MEHAEHHDDGYRDGGDGEEGNTRSYVFAATRLGGPQRGRWEDRWPAEERGLCELAKREKRPFAR